MTGPRGGVLSLSSAKRAKLEALLREKGAFTGPETITRRAPGQPAPLSFSQERLWFLEQMEPGSAAYNLPTTLRMRGVLDAGALGRALDEVVRRHEVLRTTFSSAAGEPVQVVAPAASVPLPVADLSALPEDERWAEVRRRASDHAAMAFDLTQGPLLRAELLRLGAEEHVLLLCIHHIAADGWSLSVLNGELSALYAGFAAGVDAALPEPVVQYADYAAWQRRRVSGDVLREQLAWWRGALAGAPASLELPADRPRPPVQTQRGGDHRLELPAELAHPLRALGRAEGATLYMTLLAAYAVLLSRWSGQDDVVVGSPIAGRTQAEVEGLIGLFLNTLALRTDLSGDPTFRELLGRVRAVTLDAFARQDVPFERLVEELRVPRDLSRSPLFQALFSLQNAPRGELRLGGVELSPVELETGLAKFDFSLYCLEGESGITCIFNYNADLFDAETVARMADGFRALLAAAAADPDRPAAALPLLDAAGRARLLDGWNTTEMDYAALPVHALFEAQAARTPQRVAVVHNGEAVTYAELDAEADRIARRLRAAGVGAETRVGVCMERSPRLVAALLGIWKAGGAYVPMDPAYPDERLAYMLEHSAAPVVVTESHLRDALPAAGARVLCLDAMDSADEALDAIEIESTATAASLAYVLYTSGSTGRPKGVMVPHGALAAFLAAMRREPGLGADDVMLAVTTLSFDIAGLELYLPLTTGARVVLADRETAADGARLLELARESGATVMQATPATWRLLVEAGWSRADGLAAFCGGEALPAELAAELCERATAAWNLYGPTETTIWSAAAPVRAGEPVTLGRPIANTRVYVLDRRGEPVPAGVAGELCIGGHGVARGYLGRAALTAERFVPDAHGAAGARVYRTGDLARWRGDGRLEFMGRMDDQVKVRGHRIEPGEVEAALSAHPDVAQAAVAAVGEGSARRLAAYVVVRPGAVSTAAALRGWARDRLPEYMVPSAFVFLDALPLTPNGKVDRRALPAPEAPAAAEWQLPATPTEEVLGEVWAQALGVERVGRGDDFFALGGHSLLAMRVVARLRDVLGVEVPVRALFEAPTLAELGARVDALRAAGGPAPAGPITPAARGAEPLPLSFAQQRLWFLDQMQPGDPTYNLPVATRLHGALDAAVLERAIAEIVRRHEALRTRLVAVDGVAAQQVDAPAFALAIEDLRWVPAGEREAAAAARAADEARAPFDLARGPFRARLLKLDAEEHLLLVSMHHSASDAWSLGVFFRELSALYAAFLAGEASPLAPLPVQYADFAVWQRRHLSGDTLQRQLDFWRGQLEGAPSILELPTDHPRPAVRAFRGARANAVLSRPATDAVLEMGRREGATLFMTVLSAWQLLLARYSGQDDVVVGTPVAGRGRAETEPLIGFFANTLALRARLGGDPDFRTVLRAARETTLEAYAHQDLPFEKLVDELQPERSLSHTPVFQVMFTLQNAAAARVELPGVTARWAMPEGAASKFDLSLFAAETKDGLALSLVYDTDLFLPQTAERALTHLSRLLEAAAVDPSRPVSTLPLLDEAEAAAELFGTNEADAGYGAPRCIHHWIADRISATPDAPAVRGETDAISYAEMDARADAIARRLRALGVGPEVRVGLCLERSADAIAALLGVLRAGGAYVPLDPSFPAERLGYMLEDSGARVLITESSLLDGLPAGGPVRICLDDPRALGVSAESAAERMDDVRPENTAYVIYTSGSTGRSRGVAVEHRQLWNYVRAVLERLRLPAGCGFAHVSTLAADLGNTALFPALCTSGCLHLLSRERVADPEAMAAYGREHRIDCLKIVPSHLAALLGGSDPLSVLPRRVLVVGGEASRAEWVDEVRRIAPDLRVMNHYGPTETTVGVLTWEGEPAETRGGTLPLGRPIGNARAYVLDAALRPQPAGVPGELYVGGAAVARGYLGRTGLTADRYLPDPWAGVEGARMYRTGDRVRRLPDGALEFLGRVDEQVKIRGFRVSPDEVEAAIRRHPAVAAATVAAREERPGEKRLVAWVAAPASAAESLRAHLEATLPEYMVPSATVFVDALPLTANGKVDRRALPEPAAPVAASAEGGEPRTPAEAALARIWAEVLRLDRVGVDDNFFMLGGDSILSIQVIARAARAGLRLTPRQMFEHQTVAGLAAVARPIGAPVAEQGPVTGPVPLTPVQRAFLGRRPAQPHHYNMPMLLEVDAAVSADVVQTALAHLLRHHDALRLSYRPVAGGWTQESAAPADGFALERVDLAGLDPAEQERRMADGCARAQAGIALDAGCLLRAVLFDLGDDRPRRLMLAVHHLGVDGVSWRVLLEDLQTACEQAMRGESVALPPKTTPFRQWGERLAELATTAELAEEAAYWGAACARPTPLPVDQPWGRNTVGGARTLIVRLDEEETRALVQDVPAACHTRIDDALLAALAMAFHGWTGSDSLLVALEGHGRESAWDDVDLSRTVGWFTAIYPVRLEGGAAAPGRALTAARETLRAVPRKGLGYGVLRYLAQGPAAAALAALPEPLVSFNYLGQMDAAFTGTSLLRPARGDRGADRSAAQTRRYLLDVICHVTGGRLHVQWTYGEGLHRAETVQALADAYLARLRGILDHARSADAATLTPGDFPAARISQGDLDTLLLSLAG